MLAVLPFDNIGGDPQSAYFSAGVTEDISSRLSRVPSLRVISRSSSARFKEMGKPLSQIDDELGASAVLEGTVRRAGDRVRVAVQLVDVAANEQLWAETYEHDLTDVFAIQSSIATRVAEALRARLGPSERTHISRPLTANMAAYDEYLRGRYQFSLRTGASMQAAAEHFRRAIALQPDFAAAHSGLSDVYAHLEDYDVLDHQQAFPLAIASARRAVSLDPGSAEAQASLGHVFTHQRRFGAAEAHLRKAVALDPSYATAQHWLGLLLRIRGRGADALAQHRMAQELDPVSRTTNMNLGVSLYTVGDYPNAVRQYQRTLQLFPDHGATLEYLSWALARSGQAEQALAVRRKAMEVHVKGGLSSAREKVGMAEILALAGRPEEARRLLAEAEAKDGSVDLDSAYMARGYAALGDVSGALRWIERAISGEWSDLDTAHAGDPAFAQVRRDPRYAALMRRKGLLD